MPAHPAGPPTEKLWLRAISQHTPFVLPDFSGQASEEGGGSNWQAGQPERIVFVFYELRKSDSKDLGPWPGRATLQPVPRLATLH